ncbi:SHOCT domain-containing protein [Thetidibacter halocola]|uniref:SHOCT domain-containing protein n=1 Tax=Thetidibacter halocola TaxID=2827239 RepID=A0A8J7WDZ0_9RHOB|nr:SHOCT domain-containing protein [Thetidibacter halocola]MBS0125855.1 SHOCT domain-containing protein [Thetidibacter halocola]
MQFSDNGTRVQDRLARQYGISPDAVRTMMDAVSRGGGYQAQFSHPELGGMGQWQRGGMIMVGDMFNANLQALVSNLCNDISDALSEGSFYKPAAGGLSGGSGNWWPSDLGQPSSTGMQNDQGYAIFPATARLAMLQNGLVRIYDTGAHRIGGVGQQQAQDGSVTFTSQLGPVPLSQLREITATEPDADTRSTPDETPGQDPLPAHMVSVESPPVTTPKVAQTPALQAAPDGPNPLPASGTVDVYEALSRLGELRDKGILTDAEFQAKKTELLARI